MILMWAIPFLEPFERVCPQNGFARIKIIYVPDHINNRYINNTIRQLKIGSRGMAGINCFRLLFLHCGHKEEGDFPFLKWSGTFALFPGCDPHLHVLHIH
jgi:hypothetical protein